jgi:hypothetical protein
MDCIRLPHDSGSGAKGWPWLPQSRAFGFHKVVIISGLDEELKIPKDKFCTAGLVKILRQGAVKKYTLVHIYKGNNDLKTNGQEGTRQPLVPWGGKGTCTRVMKEWIRKGTCTRVMKEWIRKGTCTRVTKEWIRKGTCTRVMKEWIRKGTCTRVMKEWIRKGTCTRVMKEWISYLQDGTSVISRTSPFTPMFTAVKRSVREQIHFTYGMASYNGSNGARNCLFPSDIVVVVYYSLSIIRLEVGCNIYRVH